MTIAEKLKKEGIKEGIEKGIIEMVRNMLNVGMDIKQIVKVSKMTEEKIKLLKEEIKH